MRSILIIVAVVLVALGVGKVLQPKRDLSPAPQIDAQVKKELEQVQVAKTVDQSKAKEKAAELERAAADFKPPREGAIKVNLHLDPKGDIVLELYPKVAPKTVARFVELVKAGYYDGIKFHRVVPDFVVQAGDPNTKQYTETQLAGLSAEEIESSGLGAGGSGHKIPFENSPLKNLPGTVAIALSRPRSDTGDSQFFINLRTNSKLDGDYCVFGSVVAGFDVVSRITQGDEIKTAVAKN